MSPKEEEVNTWMLFYALDVPSWANWIVVDRGDIVWYFTDKPVFSIENTTWLLGRIGGNFDSFNKRFPIKNIDYSKAIVKLT